MSSEILSVEIEVGDSDDDGAQSNESYSPLSCTLSLSKISERNFVSCTRLRHTNEILCKIGTIQVILDGDFELCNSKEQADIWKSTVDLTTGLNANGSIVNQKSISDENFTLITNFRTTKIENLDVFEYDRTMDERCLFTVEDERNNELYFSFLSRKLHFRVDISKIRSVLDQLPVIWRSGHNSSYDQYNNILKRCASISVHRKSLKSTRFLCSSSISIAFNDIEVLFDLDQPLHDMTRSNSLVFTMKSLSYRLFPSSAGRYDSPASQVLKSHNLWTSADSVLPVIANNIREKSLTPVLLELNNLQVSVVGISGNVRDLLRESVSIKSIMPRFDPFWNELIEVHQNPIDILSSPINFIIHMSDIEIFLFYFSQISWTQNSMKNIRLKPLAPFSSTIIHVNFDSIDVCICTDEVVDDDHSLSTLKNIVQNSMYTFGEQLKNRSEGDFLEALEMHLKLKLEYVGVPFEISNSIVDSFRDSRNLDDALSRVDKFLRRGKELPLIHAKISGMHTSYYTLTYDHKFVFNFEEIRMFDNFGNVIFNVKKKNEIAVSGSRNDCLFTPKVKRKTTTFTQPRRIDSDADNDAPDASDPFSSFSLTLTIQDLDHSWGRGGYPVTALYDYYLKSIVNVLPSREENLMIKIDQFFSFVSIDELKTAVEVVEQIFLSWKRSNRHQTESILREKSSRKYLKLSIQSIIESADVFLQTTTDMIACISAYGVKLVVSDVLNSATKIPRFVFSIDDLRILDLSAAFPYYYRVLYREERSRETMIKFSSKVLESVTGEKTELSLIVCRCRIVLDLHFLIETFSKFLVKLSNDVLWKLFRLMCVFDDSYKSNISALTIEYEHLSFLFPLKHHSIYFIMVQIRHGEASLHTATKHWFPPEKTVVENGYLDNYFDISLGEWEIGGSRTTKRESEMSFNESFPRIVISSHDISIHSHTTKMFEVTKQEFSRRLLIEWRPLSTGAVDNIRILVTDIKHRQNDIALDLSFLQYNLLLGIIYNQIGFISKLPVWNSASPNIGDVYNEYGSEGYCKYLINQPTSLEFLWTSKFVSVSFLVERDQCANFPSLSDMSSSHFLQVCEAEVSHAVLHCMYGGDTFRLALGCGGCELEDLRSPRKTLHPKILSSASYLMNKLRFSSYADFDYGITTVPSFQTLNETLDLPLQLTYFRTRSTGWNTCNIGLSCLNFHLKDTEMFSILSQFLNFYFNERIELNSSKRRISIFRKNIEKESINTENGPLRDVVEEETGADLRYSEALDFRIFCYKPHMTVPKDPMSDHLEMLMIETNNGIYTRFTIDSFGTYKIETQLNDIAVVIFKRYSPPELSRGRRGISGSDFGVRTALEFLCCSFSYDFDATVNTVDVKIHLCPASMRSSNRFANDGSSGDEETSYERPTKYVKLDTDVFENSSQVNLPNPPKCVFQMNSPSTRSLQSSCDVVISCLDGFFIMGCCYGIFGTFSLFETFLNLFGYLKEGELSHNTADELTSYYVEMQLQCVRLIVVDDTLGLHQPLLQSFFDNVDLLLFSHPEHLSGSRMRRRSLSTGKYLFRNI